MISASIVDSTVSVCNLDCHKTQFATVITNQVLLLTQKGSLEFLCPYIPAKSASGQQSIFSSFDGFNTRPRSRVAFRYQPILFNTNSWDLLGQNIYLAQQLTAQAMSVHVCPAKYRSIPTTLLQLKSPKAGSLSASYTKPFDSAGVNLPEVVPTSKPRVSITLSIRPVCFNSIKPVV